MCSPSVTRDGEAATSPVFGSTGARQMFVLRFVPTAKAMRRPSDDDVGVTLNPAPTMIGAGAPVARVNLASMVVGRKVSTPADSAAVFTTMLQDEASEVFAILCLSTKHRVLAYHEVSRGCLDSTLVHPREVFKAALLANAAAIVLAHNHPSGDATPSPDDMTLTRPGRFQQVDRRGRPRPHRRRRRPLHQFPRARLAVRCDRRQLGVATA
jgi:RadC-like JAB domain